MRQGNPQRPTDHGTLGAGHGTTRLILLPTGQRDLRALVLHLSPVRRYGPRQPASAPVCRYYRPEHIPAFLEHRWYVEHLAPLSLHANDSEAMRRYAAARLVRWATGASLSEALDYLGLPPGTTLQFAHSDRRRLDRALNAIARHIELAPAPINYHGRRAALDNWCLPEADWERFIDYLRPTRGRRDAMRSDSDRQHMSIFIWARITQGEYRYAPRPIEATFPDPVRQVWWRNRLRIQCQLEKPPRPGGFYAAIRPVLVNYAAQLARRIDAGEWPSA